MMPFNLLALQQKKIFMTRTGLQCFLKQLHPKMNHCSSTFGVYSKAYLVCRDPLRDQQLLGLVVMEGLADLWDLAPLSCLGHPENL